MPDRDAVLAKVRTALTSVLEDDDATTVGPHHLGRGSRLRLGATIASLTIALEDEFDDVLAAERVDRQRQRARAS